MHIHIKFIFIIDAANSERIVYKQTANKEVW